jgi:hypothetical protein
MGGFLAKCGVDQDQILSALYLKQRQVAQAAVSKEADFNHDQSVL